MATVATTVPAWETARRKRCFQQFIKMKCVKKGHEELDVDADDFDVTLLDEEKMKCVLMDCVAALGVVREMRIDRELPLTLKAGGVPLSKETEAVRNDAFAISLSLAATSLLHDAAKKPKQSASVDLLLRAFPRVTNGEDDDDDDDDDDDNDDDDDDDSHTSDWLPLHWAVLAFSTPVENDDAMALTETDVKVIYASDPLALQQYHQVGTGGEDDGDDNDDNMGFTPAQLLCTREMTNRSMSLIKHFSICNSQAFTMSASYSSRGDVSLYGYSALHAACGLGQPTEELLQHLLQLDSSQSRKKGRENGFTPLGYLCANSNCSDRLIPCLLGVDSSAEVVGNGIAGCLQFTDYGCVLARLDMLLKANPEAAKYRDEDGSNLLHSAARQKQLPFQLCIDVMQRILAIHKDAVREKCSRGWLPVHNAARYSTVEVMEFLLGLYPESASVVTTTGSLNLLRLAVCDKENITSVMEAKVRFLYSRYPAMMLQRDSIGFTPLHSVLWSKNIPAVQILCETGVHELVRVPVAHPTEDNNWMNGWLPLHILIMRNEESLQDSLLFEATDCFRMLLRWYPEAAGIEGDIIFKKTPYQLAVDNNLPPYYLRLLLRAAPDLDPAELHRLNYVERRMAMFLAFRARTTNIDPPFLARLRFAKIDLVKHVVSFL